MGNPVSLDALIPKEMAVKAEAVGVAKANLGTCQGGIRKRDPFLIVFNLSLYYFKHYQCIGNQELTGKNGSANTR